MPVRDLTEGEKKEIEDGLKAGAVRKLDTTVASLLNKTNVSKIVQYHIQKSPYGSNLDMFSQMYRDDTVFDAEAPKRFKFHAADDTHPTALTGHNREEMTDETVALRVAWKAAQHKAKENRKAEDISNQRDRPLYGIADGDRNNLELAWVTRDPTGLPVELENEGSDGYRGKTHKLMSAGRINCCTSTDTLGLLEQIAKNTKSITGTDGRRVDTQEEVGTVPHEQRKLEHRWLIRRTTTMMCIYGLRHTEKIQCTRKTLDTLYTYIMGPRIAGRPNNPPTTLQLRHVENKMWTTIANQLQRGEKKTLEQACTDIIGDSVFWTNEFFSYCDGNKSHQPSPGSTGTKGDGGGKKPSWKSTPWYGKGKKGDWGQYGKGKKGDYGKGQYGKGKGKGKGQYGKGNKGGQNGWNNHGWGNYSDQSDVAWQGRRDRSDPTTKWPQGQPNCRKHHLHGTCPGNCNRDHSKCPNKKADGTWCNGNHPAHKCTEGHHP